MRILATIGPNTCNEQSIKKISKYTNLFRLNGSHNTFEWHNNTVKLIRKVNNESLIFLDVPGIKPRTNNKETILINKNEIVSFCYNTKNKNSNNKIINLTRPLPKLKTKPTYFTINDGLFSFKCKSFEKNFLTAKALDHFNIESKKGLNIPYSEYDDILQTKLIFNFFKVFEKLNVDGYGISFVQNEAIIKLLKSKFPNKVIISKIENYLGLKNVDLISKFSDIVMIDRGDLSAEIEPENLYSAIERIAVSCKSEGKPLIMATENLVTMTKNNQPTKSEIISLGHALSINTDCIMLSEETAISKNYSAILKWLSEFIKKNKLSRKFNYMKKNDTYPLWNAISNLPEMPKVIISLSGKALFNMVKINNSNLHLITDSKILEKLCRFYSFDMKISIQKIKGEIPSKIVYKYVQKNSVKLFKKDNNICAIFVSYPFHGAEADNITIINKDKILK